MDFLKMYHNPEIQESIRLGMIERNIRSREDREDIEQECWMELHCLAGEIVELEDAKDIVRKVIRKMKGRIERTAEHLSDEEVGE
jgi:hypothetical protein